ncbi:hypothetical protein AMECASPLE_007230 [Ameca splendens]|uniref:Uncharacterized protein n=1 Tax=Ameca splendens TaxID=208324 RepID=A0ABV0YM33_9TELE
MSASVGSCSLSTALQDSEFITQDSAGNVEVLVYMYKCRYTAELQPFVYKRPITFVLKEYNQFFCGEKPYLSKEVSAVL